MLAGLMAASALVSLPVALFIIGVGGATGMMAGGSIQKEYEIGLKENDIGIKYVIMQNQLTLHKIAKGDYVDQLEYMQLRADMNDLEEQFSQNLCDIAEYKNQMEMYRTGALSTVVLVGGASISLQKLMAMSAQQAQSSAKLTEVTKYINNGRGSGTTNKSDMGDCLSIAKQNGATYELFLTLQYHELLRIGYLKKVFHLQKY